MKHGYVEPTKVGEAQAAGRRPKVGQCQPDNNILNELAVMR